MNLTDTHLTVGKTAVYLACRLWLLEHYNLGQCKRGEGNGNYELWMVGAGSRNEAKVVRVEPKTSHASCEVVGNWRLEAAVREAGTSSDGTL